MKNKKRLIDANDLWTDIMMLPHNGDMISSDEVEQAIKEAPAVDAVEVVRCKDCKHWMKDVAGCTDSVGRCEWANYMVGAVGYCVYGERKDNG